MLERRYHRPAIRVPQSGVRMEGVSATPPARTVSVCAVERANNDRQTLDDRHLPRVVDMRADGVTVKEMALAISRVSCCVERLISIGCPCYDPTGKRHHQITLEHPVIVTNGVTSISWNPSH